MSKSLLLKVEASGLVERSALGSSREERGPGRESSLHLETEEGRNGLKRANAGVEVTI